MKIIRTLSMSICLMSFTTASFAHEYENQCQNIQVPIYDDNAVDDVIAGAVIGGVLGKVVTDKDKGAAAGALIGGIIGSESSKRKITGYRTEQQCQQVALPPHSHEEQSWISPDTGDSIVIEQSRIIEERLRERQRAEQIRERERQRIEQARVTEEQKRERQRIAELQNSLNYFGFNSGSADGIIGSRTRKSIEDYQTYVGLNKTDALSDFDIKVLKGCELSSRASGETSLPDKRKTLQYCTQNEYPHLKNKITEENATNYLTNSQLENLWAVRNYHNDKKAALPIQSRGSSQNWNRATQKVSSIEKVIYENPTSARINKGKETTVEEFIKLPMELPFINNTTKGSSNNRMIIRPHINNIGDMVYFIDFVVNTNDSQGLENRQMVSDSFSSSEVNSVIEAIETYVAWSDRAKESGIKQEVTRLISCIKGCDSVSRGGIKSMSTEFNLKIENNGDTYLNISADNGNHYSIFLDGHVANVLSAYMEYVEYLYSKGYSGNFSDKELDELFR